MVNNLENGRTTYWYENGNKAREVDFKMGVPNGNWIDYYENGNGQTFMPLKTLPYNDLINGLTKIIKVNASPHTYAIIDL